MAFNTNKGRQSFTATGGQTDFDFNFKIYEDTDLKVYLTPVGQDPDDATDLLTITTDYTVPIDGDNGGTVILTSGATLNDTLVVERVLTRTRSVSYVTNGDLKAVTLNEDQDYQTYLLVDDFNAADRAIYLPSTDVTMSTELPATLTNGYLKVKTDGTGFEYVLFDGSAFEDIRTIPSVDDFNTIDTNIFTVAIVKDVDRGGLFFYDASLSGTNNGGTIFDGWVRYYSGDVNVKWFGVQGDGTTDDTSNLQTCLDTHTNIYIPAGDYKTTSTLNISTENTKIKGNGRGTRIQPNFDGDHIKVSNSSGYLYGITIEHLKIAPTVNLTTGASLVIDGCRHLNLEDIEIDDAFVGLKVASGQQVTINDVLVLYESNNGGLITGRKFLELTSSTNPNITSEHNGDVLISNFNGRCGSSNYCEIGVYINSSDGIWFNNFHIGNCVDANMQIDANTTTKVTGVLATNGWFDLGDATGLLITGSTPTVTGNHQFSSNKFLGGNAGEHGIDINGSADNIIIDGNEISNYDFSGILIRDTFTGDGEIKNNIIRDCSQNAVGAANCIDYGSDTVWRIENNTIYGTRHARHIFVDGTKTEAYINNNILRSTATVTKMNELQGTTISQKENIGFNPTGSVSTAVGASPWTYTNTKGYPIQMYVHGGGAGTITDFIHAGVDINGTVDQYMPILQPGQSITVTYTGAIYAYMLGL